MSDRIRDEFTRVGSVHPHRVDSASDRRASLLVRHERRYGEALRIRRPLRWRCLHAAAGRDLPLLRTIDRHDIQIRCALTKHDPRAVGRPRRKTPGIVVARENLGGRPIDVGTGQAEHVPVTVKIGAGGVDDLPAFGRQVESVPARGRFRVDQPHGRSVRDRVIQLVPPLKNDGRSVPTPPDEVAPLLRQERRARR